MKATHDATTVNNFVTSFGYSTSDPQWILVPPATTAPDAGAKETGGSGGGRDAGSADPGTGGTLGNRDAGRGSIRATGGAGGSAGGAGAGGTSASGGRGGSAGDGGSGSGGSRVVSSGRSGGASDSGGTSGGGSAGGAGSDGTSASGSGGSKPASSENGSGGTSVSRVAESKSGCGLGGASYRAGGMGLALAFAALIAGQLRRLLVRRENLTKPAPPADEPSPEATISADESRRCD
jgi:hypothetical protein